MRQAEESSFGVFPLCGRDVLPHVTCVPPVFIGNKLPQALSPGAKPVVSVAVAEETGGVGGLSVGRQFPQVSFPCGPGKDALGGADP